MMRMKAKTKGFLNSPTNNESSANGRGGGEREGAAEWEVRPGGMLVQRRTLAASDQSSVAPMIRIRVKYKSTYHEININSQSTFGNNSSALFVSIVVNFELIVNGIGWFLMTNVDGGW